MKSNFGGANARRKPAREATGVRIESRGQVFLFPVILLDKVTVVWGSKGAPCGSLLQTEPQE